MSWQGRATWHVLQQRAALLTHIRSFFAKRDVLEVETPILARTTTLDPTIHSLSTCYTGPHYPEGQAHYLQTSPEFAMKRLLAQYGQSIYQISKAFRNGEYGRYHHPEFTLLEWYRVGFELPQLMDEMEALLQSVLKLPQAERISYQALYKHYVGIDPHSATCEQIQACMRTHHIESTCDAINHKDDGLNLLLTHVIEPELKQIPLVFIYDYPVSQSALARIRQGTPACAERFEVYLNGIELANGFCELTDAKEQQTRFERELKVRKAQGLDAIPIDYALLAALKHGLPLCSGVALGVDRLLMQMVGARCIQEVLAFELGQM